MSFMSHTSVSKHNAMIGRSIRPLLVFCIGALLTSPCKAHKQQPVLRITSADLPGSPDGFPLDFDFSRDDGRVAVIFATAQSKMTVGVWEIRSKRLLVAADLDDSGPLAWLTKSQIRFAANGEKLIVLGQTRLFVLDSLTLRPLLSFLPVSGPSSGRQRQITGFTISGDGRRLAYISGGRMLIHPSPVLTLVDLNTGKRLAEWQPRDGVTALAPDADSSYGSVELSYDGRTVLMAGPCCKGISSPVALLDSETGATIKSYHPDFGNPQIMAGRAYFAGDNQLIVKAAYVDEVGWKSAGPLFEEIALDSGATTRDGPERSQRIGACFQVLPVAQAVLITVMREHLWNSFRETPAADADFELFSLKTGIGVPLAHNPRGGCPRVSPSTGVWGFMEQRLPTVPPYAVTIFEASRGTKP